jgi:hypothetical protein
VALADAFARLGYIRVVGEQIRLMPAGAQWLADNSIPTGWRRTWPTGVRPCLDWTARKPHLAGAVPAAILRHILAHRYLVRRDHTRALHLTAGGREWFAQLSIFDGMAGGLPSLDRVAQRGGHLRGGLVRRMA